MTTLSEAFEEDGSPSPKKLRKNYEIFIDNEVKSDESGEEKSLIKLQQIGDKEASFNYVSPMKKNYFDDDLVRSPS